MPGATSIQFESYNRIFCADRHFRNLPVKMIIERGLYPTLFYHFLQCSNCFSFTTKWSTDDNYRCKTSR